MFMKKAGLWIQYVLVRAHSLSLAFGKYSFSYVGIQACQESNEAEKLFYNGYDLVEYFMRDANSKMVDYMNELATK